MDKRPTSLAVARVVLGLAGIAVLLALPLWFLGSAYGCHDSTDPHCAVKVTGLAASVLPLPVCCLCAAVRLGGYGRKVRRAWWAGIVGGALVAVGGAAMIHSPVRTHQTDLVPELFWGLAVLAVAATILAALFVPGTRRWVEDPSPPPPEEEETRLAEAHLSTSLQTEVERMRRVAMTRGYLITVTALSGTEAIVEMGTGRFRLTVGNDGHAKVEGA